MEKGLICCAIFPGVCTLRVDLQGSHSSYLLGLLADGDLMWHMDPHPLSFQHLVPSCLHSPGA